MKALWLALGVGIILAAVGVRAELGRASSSTSVYLPAIPNGCERNGTPGSTASSTATATPTPSTNPTVTACPTASLTPTETVTSTVLPNCRQKKAIVTNFTCPRKQTCRGQTDVGPMSVGQTLTMWVNETAPPSLPFSYGSSTDLVDEVLTPGDSEFTYAPTSNQDDVSFGWVITGAPGGTKVTLRVTWQVCTGEYPPGVRTPTPTSTA